MKRKRWGLTAQEQDSDTYLNKELPSIARPIRATGAAVIQIVLDKLPTRPLLLVSKTHQAEVLNLGLSLPGK
jgi:hypothetical protein